MGAIKLMEGIYWVGAVDWNIRHFHGSSLSTHRGTTYNAYLIIDEKIALVDTVYPPFATELLANIREIVDPSQIDYVIANHVEVDHSGALPQLLAEIGSKPVYCTAKGQQGLAKHYQQAWDFRVIKTGEQVSLGQKTLSFIEAPMLHWPDSMFTYIPEDGLLLPNDAFGQHLATAGRFDDEVDLSVIMDEATKYYANILWPFSKLVVRKLQELTEQKLRLNMIAPSHGVIWRKHISTILNAYSRWASGAGEQTAIVVYDTMWGSTAKLAEAICAGMQKAGLPTELRQVGPFDQNDLIKELLAGKALVIGCPAINRTVLPPIASLLDELEGLKPQARYAACFGSYGWNGGAIEKMQASLEKAGLQILQDPFACQWVPTAEEVVKAQAWGSAFAEKLLATKE